MARQRLQYHVSALLIALVMGSSSAHASAYDNDQNAMLQIGLLPEAAVVAGLAALEIEALLERLLEAEAERDALSSANADLDQAVGDLTSATAALRHNPDDPVTQDAYELANQQVNAASEALDVAQVALADLVFTGVSSEVVESIRLYKDNLRYRVPASFRVLDRTESQWRVIESAVRTEARCIRQGRTVPSQVALILQDVRSHPSVIHADLLLQAHLSEMRALLLGNE